MVRNFLLIFYQKLKRKEKKTQNLRKYSKLSTYKIDMYVLLAKSELRIRIYLANEDHRHIKQTNSHMTCVCVCVRV